MSLIKRTMKEAIFCAIALLLSTSSLAGTESAGQALWSFSASYQGLLSAGLPLDIAEIRLQSSPPSPGAAREARISLSSVGFGATELIMPLRYCYRSRMSADTGITLDTDWWSRIGNKASRGRLLFDRDQRRVLRLHTERKLQEEAYDDELAQSTLPSPAKLDHDLDTLPFPAGVLPMDRLAMLLWLREQDLRPGQVLEPPISDGRKLQGFRIRVEAEETLDWHGEIRDSLRIRLEPLEKDGKTADPTWLWLSRDTQRLPLKFSSKRAFGRFEMRLQPSPAGAPQCHIPEAMDLALPAVEG